MVDYFGCYFSCSHTLSAFSLCYFFIFLFFLTSSPLPLLEKYFMLFIFFVLSSAPLLKGQTDLKIFGFTRNSCSLLWKTHTVK